MAPLLNKNKTHKDLSYSTAFSHLLNYEHVLCKTKKENGLQIQRNGSQCKMFRLMFRCVIQRSLFLFLYRLYSTLIHDISFPGFRKKEAQWLRLTDFFNAVVTCFWRHSSVFFAYVCIICIDLCCYLFISCFVTLSRSSVPNLVARGQHPKIPNLPAIQADEHSTLFTLTVIVFYLICHEYTLTSSGWTDTFWGLRARNF